MRVRRARTSCDTSLMILAFSFGDRVVNHLARRYEQHQYMDLAEQREGGHTTLPCLESRMR